MDEEVAPGLVERVDHLTAAVADLGFRLDTLIGSTIAFRDSVSDRLTDYADLVARWSMEAEDNVAAYRDTVSGLPAAVAAELTAALAKVERRTTEALEALSEGTVRRLDGVGHEVRGLREALAEAVAADEAGDAEPDRTAEVLGAVVAEVSSLRDAVRSIPQPEPDASVDALAAVLAEVAALRDAVRSIPQPEPVVIPPFPEPPAVEIPPFPEIPPPPDLSPLVAELAAVREELAALRPAEVDATVEELRGLRREIARLPQGRDELASLAEEVRGLRAAVAEAAADEVEDAEETEGALEGLAAEVAAMREALASVQVRLDERPAVPHEVTALTAELQALRAELQEAPDEAPAPAPAIVSPAAPSADLEPIQDALAELTFEVRALRKRLRLRADPE